MSIDNDDQASSVAHDPNSPQPVKSVDTGISQEMSSQSNASKLASLADLRSYITSATELSDIIIDNDLASSAEAVAQDPNPPQPVKSVDTVLQRAIIEKLFPQIAFIYLRAGVNKYISAIIHSKLFDLRTNTDLILQSLITLIQKYLLKYISEFFSPRMDLSYSNLGGHHGIAGLSAAITSSLTRNSMSDMKPDQYDPPLLGAAPDSVRFTQQILNNNLRRIQPSGEFSPSTTILSSIKMVRAMGEPFSNVNEIPQRRYDLISKVVNWRRLNLLHPLDFKPGSLEITQIIYLELGSLLGVPDPPLLSVNPSHLLSLLPIAPQIPPGKPLVSLDSFIWILAQQSWLGVPDPYPLTILQNMHVPIKHSDKPGLRSSPQDSTTDSRLLSTAHAGNPTC